MSDHDRRIEASMLDAIVPQIEAEGFEVYARPSSPLLPTFLEGLRPDALAFKDGRKVVIEILRSSNRSDEKLVGIRKALAEHPDWELRLIYAPPLHSLETFAPPTRAVMEAYLDRVGGAFDGVGPAAGLLTGWSVFEAAARSVAPNAFARPQTPARLVEELASKGLITPQEGDHLRGLGRLRSQAVHGRLDVPVTRADLEALVAITRSLLDGEVTDATPSAA